MEISLRRRIKKYDAKAHQQPQHQIFHTQTRHSMQRWNDSQQIIIILTASFLSYRYTAASAIHQVKCDAYYNINGDAMLP